MPQTNTAGDQNTKGFSHLHQVWLRFDSGTTQCESLGAICDCPVIFFNGYLCVPPWHERLRKGWQNTLVMSHFSKRFVPLELHLVIPERLSTSQGRQKLSAANLCTFLPAKVQMRLLQQTHEALINICYTSSAAQIHRLLLWYKVKLGICWRCFAHHWLSFLYHPPQEHLERSNQPDFSFFWRSGICRASRNIPVWPTSAEQLRCCGQGSTSSSRLMSSCSR